MVFQVFEVLGFPRPAPLLPWWIGEYSRVSVKRSKAPPASVCSNPFSRGRRIMARWKTHNVQKVEKNDPRHENGANIFPNLRGHYHKTAWTVLEPHSRGFVVRKLFFLWRGAGGLPQPPARSPRDRPKTPIKTVLLQFFWRFLFDKA